MARPKKVGLEYFPLDVDFPDDQDVELIDSEFGAEGFALLIRLYCAIYKNGYFLPFGRRQALFFAKKNRISQEKVTEIVKACVEWELFDEDLYHKFGILTSQRIQKIYFDATQKRTQVEADSDYLLISVNSHTHVVSAEKTPGFRKENPKQEEPEIVSDTETHVSDTETPVFVESIPKGKGRVNTLTNAREKGVEVYQKKEEIFKEKKEAILEDEIWEENVRMKFSLSMPDYKKKIWDFLEELELKEDLFKDIREIKSHFINLLKKQNQSNERPKNTNNQRNNKKRSRIHVSEKDPTSESFATVGRQNDQ